MMRLAPLLLQAGEPLNAPAERILPDVLHGMPMAIHTAPMKGTASPYQGAARVAITVSLFIGFIVIHGPCRMSLFKLTLVFILISCMLCFGQQRLEIEVTPVDFIDNPEYPDHYPTGARNMVLNNGLIYIGHEKDPYITVIDKDGLIKKVIGQSGGGPGELGRGVLTMTTSGRDLFVASVSKTMQLTWFQDDVFKYQFHIPSRNISYSSINAGTFAAANGTVVFPAHPSTRRLANAITIDKQQSIGELLFDKKDIGLIRRIPAINDTNWQYEDGYWYCVFKFHPMIQKYDSNFKMIETFNIEDSFTADRHTEVLEFDSSRFSSAPPLFYDFKLKDGFFYLSLRGGVILVSSEGETLKLFTFHANGEPFKSAGIAGATGLHFPYFVVLDDGNLLLSSFGDSWGHPFWRAKIVDLPN